jgi:hypothetical protein
MLLRKSSYSTRRYGGFVMGRANYGPIPQKQKWWQMLADGGLQVAPEVASSRSPAATW